MYQVIVETRNSGDKILYNCSPNDDYPVSDGSVSLSLNDAGSLEMTLAPTHPNISYAKEIHSNVRVYRGDTEVFYGRLLTYDTDMFGNLKIYAEGALSFLLDSEMGKGKYNETVSEFFNRCINAHNSQVEPDKRFTVRTVRSDKANRTLKFDLTGWSQIKSVLENELISRFGGYLVVSPKSGGGHYIDYLEHYRNVSDKEIRIGSNVISKDDKRSGENVFTILHPIGQSSSAAQFDKSKSYKIGDYVTHTDNKKDYTYVCIGDGNSTITSDDNVPGIPAGNWNASNWRRLGDDDDTSITLEFVDQSALNIQNCTLSNNKLYLNDLIPIYGKITLNESFSAAKTRIELLRDAETYITKRRSNLPSVCEVNYVDFHFLNSEIDYLALGDRFTNIEGYSGEAMTVSDMSFDLVDPSNDTATFKNDEELEIDNPTSRKASSMKAASAKSGSSRSSGGLSGSSSVQYKYITEGEDLLQLHTKEIIISAEENLELASKIVNISSENMFLLASGDAENPASIHIGVSKKLNDGTEPEGASMDFTFNNIRLGVVEHDPNAVKFSTVELDTVIGSDIWINRNRISLLNGHLWYGDDGYLHVHEGSGLVIDKNDGTSLGYFNEDTLTAGVLVNKVGNASAGEKETLRTSLGYYTDGTLTSGVLVEKISDASSSQKTTLRTSLGYYTSGTLTAGVLVEKISDASSSQKETLRTSLGYYTNGTLTAGVLVEKISNSSSSQKTTLRTSLGYYTSGTLTAGVIVEKINGNATQKAALGFYDNNTLTDGILITKLNNGTSTVKIKATKINLSGYVTATDFSTLNANVVNLTAGNTTATHLKATTMTAGTFNATNFKLNGWSIYRKTVTINGTSQQLLAWGQGD